MNILGLNFGHDGAVCVIRDGNIAGYTLGERTSRIKHHVGVTTAMLHLAIKEAGITSGDIDAVAITSTQFVELLSGRINGFSIRLERHPDDETPSTLETVNARNGHHVGTALGGGLRRGFEREESKKALADKIFETYFPEGSDLDWQGMEQHGWIDTYVTLPKWRTGATLADIARGQQKLNDALRFGMHHPATVNLDGRDIPASFINHHIAHAAACFYRSGYEKSAILTHDGFGNGRSYHSGLLCWGDGTRIWPLSPHHLAIGTLYDRVASALGLGAAGGPGKLMGLAPYGKPRFFQRRFVGNDFDHAAAFGTGAGSAWLDHCLSEARRMGYDTKPYGDPMQVLAPINSDIAASTQKLFEECYLQTVEAFASMLSGTGFETMNLCLSGGTALNCPANSRIATESPFRNIFIEPSCDDSGIAIGAALFVAHNLKDETLGDIKLNQSPYLGSKASAAISLKRLKQIAGKNLTVSQPDDAAESAAQDIAADKVIGWFEGQSEIGPRALGHRSILAKPDNGENWSRVNRIKRREDWRPFAPAVLADKASDWFADSPLPSPYMLFTARVRSRSLPAITHADGSARIQTVGPENGDFYKLLSAIDRLTGIPVVLNTSFNGPGEPIVETPEEALAMFRKCELDSLYISGYRISRT